MISPKTVEAIFDAAKIEEVVGDFVQLKRRGVNMLGLCPFHNEKTPSFTVSPAKGIYKCFGCGAGGNAVNFVMEHEQLSYPEALRYLAGKYDIHIEEKEVSEEYKAQQRLADSLYIANNFAQKYYESQLFGTDYGLSVGLGYFKERGFREEIIKRFGLGFSNGQHDDFSKNAAHKGYDKALLQKAGLLSKSGRDFFRMRVMFPIHNLSGKVIAFGGRILTNNKKQPKYLNTPETDIYNKSKSLYGIYFARKAIVKRNECYLVEGYTDVLSLHQAGIENTVASSGTSLTIGQIQLIKRYSSNITILYDGDAAGVKAALRGLDLVLEQDMNVKVVLLPQGEDPDSYLQKVGATAFEEYIQSEASDFILFKTNLLTKETANDPIRRAELLKDIVKTLAKIPDSLKRSVYVRECAARMGIGESLLHAEINKNLKNIIKNKKLEKEKKQQDAPPPSDIALPEQAAMVQSQASAIAKEETDEYQERDMVRILMQFGDREFNKESTVAEFLLENMIDLVGEFDSGLYAGIIAEYIEKLEEGELLNLDHFIQHKNEEVSKLAVHLVSTPYVYSPNWVRLDIYLNSQKMPEENHIAEAKSIILRFKLHKINRLAQRNQEKIKNLKDDPQEMMITLQVQQRILEMRKEVALQLNTVIT